MSRKAKGKRPGYFNDSECDKLLPSLRGRAASRPVTVEHDRPLARVLSSLGALCRAERRSDRRSIWASLLKLARGFNVAMVAALSEEHVSPWLRRSSCR